MMDSDDFLKRYQHEGIDVERELSSKINTELIEIIKKIADLLTLYIMKTGE